jgi:phosphohistidine phosphatase SixA
MQRRPFVASALAAALPRFATAREAVEPLLRAGGVVIAFRHALAPGTFDPPGFRVDDCSTQRNLNDEGREQARQLGAWFKARGLVPARVRSSPWCRCVDTATLALGTPERWAALGSPVRSDAALRERRTAELRQALAAVPAGRFEAWVTHQFVLQDLAGTSTSPAEALVLRAGSGGVQLLARATLY